MTAVNKEPSWLKGYRTKNIRVFEDKPLKKSKYFDVDKLDSFLRNKKSNDLKIPRELLKKNIKVLTFEQAIKEIPSKIRYILCNEESPKTQYEAFINAYRAVGY